MRCAVVVRDAMRGLVAFARCSCKRRQRHAFDGGILRVLRNGFRDGRRVGFININDMYNNDVGQGVVYVYEAYEAK